MFKRGRRKMVLVDRHFQLMSALRNIMYMLAVGICLSLPFFYFIRATNFLVYSHGNELNELVRTQERSTLITVILYFGLLICVSALFTIWQSHKVAGPVIAVKNSMEKIAKGRFDTRLRLRSGDELKALADAFNDMAEKLQARDEAITQKINQSKSSSSMNSSLSSL